MCDKPGLTEAHPGGSSWVGASFESNGSGDSPLVVPRSSSPHFSVTLVDRTASHEVFLAF